MFLNHSLFEAIFKLASNGRIIRLKTFLEARTEEEIQMVTRFKFGGATPLIMACRNGHRDVVEYLVTKCKADVEETGAVVFDQETIEGAPPLWCASAAGHLPIVQFLVESGAQVNSKTRTNSTPLRAACFDGHYAIVKYLVQHGADYEVSNRHGHTCLMIACYKGHYKIVRYLLSLKADMNRKSTKGNTALHDCAEAGSLEILKLLLENGAHMDTDAYGMTPLLAAAVVGHQHIVEYLLALPTTERKDKIDALELLGATFVDRKKDMMCAMELWRRGMDLRFLKSDAPILKPENPITQDAYEHAREVYDHESLQEIRGDPDAIKNQALLIRERILGPGHPDTIYFLRYRGAMYADSGKFSRCISLWNYALDMQQDMLEPLNHLTLSTLYSFCELFEFMLTEKGQISSRGRQVPALRAEDVILVIEKCVLEAKNAARYNITDELLVQRLLTVALNIAALLTTHWKEDGRRTQEEQQQNIDTFTKEEKFRLRKAMFELVKVDLRGRDEKTLLHYSCQPLYSTPLASESRDYATSIVPLLPNYDVTRILCKVGADTNAKDKNGNTPLHILSEHFLLKQTSILKLLLKHDAHYDTVNQYKKTFMDILQDRLTLYAQSDPSTEKRDGLMLLRCVVRHLGASNQFTSLKCLAAKCIQKNKINVAHWNLPENMLAFIRDH